MRVIGIDPGKSGAVVAVDAQTLVGCLKMPLMGKDINWKEVADFVISVKTDDTRAVLEKVHAMPGQGVNSMFSFGGSFHGIQAVLQTLSVPYQLVTPQAWKKVVLAGTAKDKDAAVAWCQRSFPTASLLASPRCKKPHDGICDALCLAEWGRLHWK